MKALAIVIATLLASGGTALAQTLYKSTMPDGKVIYSQKPEPGAKRVDTVEPPPAKTGVTAATPQEKARADQAVKNATAQQSNALDDARRQLQKAEAARDTGKEPLPGERLGTAGGASRLTDAYFERQKSLELAVDSARKRVNELERR